MKKGKGGFLLLMFCMYLACVSVLMMITIPFVFKVFQTMLSMTQKNRMLHTVDLIFLVVMNDLCRAPSERMLFKQLSDTEIIWTNGDLDIGLVYDKVAESLFRFEGQYNTEEKFWSSKHRSLIARNVEVEFTIMGISCVVFACTVSVDSLQFRRIVIPQNCSYVLRKL